MVTWGMTPEHAVGVGEPVPEPRSLPAAERALVEEAWRTWAAAPGRRWPAPDRRRLHRLVHQRPAVSDIEEVAKVVTRTGGRVAPARARAGRAGVRGRGRRHGGAGATTRCFATPGFECPRAGLLDVPGDEPRPAGRRQVCASSSNRNFKGRQGSPTGRTLLMSPAMVAAAAIAGEVVDARTLAGPAPATPAAMRPR